jgi:streptogramin lyase
MLGKERKRRKQSGSKKQYHSNRPSRSRRLWLELLEDRTLLSNPTFQALANSLTDPQKGLTAVQNQVTNALNTAPLVPLLSQQLGNYVHQLNTPSNFLQSAFIQTFQNDLNTYSTDADLQKNLASDLGAKNVTVTDLNSGAGVEISMDLQQSNTAVPNGGSFSTGTPLDSVLKASSGGVRVQVGYDYQLDVGYNQGIFFGNPNSLKVNAQASIASPINITLGFLPGMLADNNNPNSSVNIDFTATGIVPNSTPQFSLDGLANLNLHFHTTVDAGYLPTIAADFGLNWGFGSHASLPSVAFNNVTMDMGKAVSDIVKPVRDAVDEFVVPGQIQHLVDMLETPIPLISDLSEAAFNTPFKVITLIDALASKGVDLSPLYTVIDLVEAYDTFQKEVNDFSNAGTIQFGSFNVDLNRLQPTNPQGPANQDPTVQDDLNTIENDWEPEPSPVRVSFGLKVPLLTDPMNGVFQLLLGRDVNLVELQGDFNANIAIEKTFPILGILSVGFEGSLALSGHCDLGYDAAGLQKFLQDPNHNPGDLSQGVFVTSDTGVSLVATLEAVAKLDLVVFHAQVGGGISGSVSLTADPTQPVGTKLRIPLPAPVPTGGISAIFNAEIQVGVSIFGTFFGWTKDFDIANITLLSFGPDFPPPQDPLLAEFDPNNPGRLILFMGPNYAGMRQYVPGDSQPSDTEAENYTVYEGIDREQGNRQKVYSPNGPIPPNQWQGGGDTITVEAFGSRQFFTGVTSIYAEGGTGENGVTIEKNVRADAELHGGSLGYSVNNFTYLGNGDVHFFGGRGPNSFTADTLGATKYDSGPTVEFKRPRDTISIRGSGITVLNPDTTGRDLTAIIQPEFGSITVVHASQNTVGTTSVEIQGPVTQEPDGTTVPEPAHYQVDEGGSSNPQQVVTTVQNSDHSQAFAVFVDGVPQLIIDALSGQDDITVNEDGLQNSALTDLELNVTDLTTLAQLEREDVGLPLLRNFVTINQPPGDHSETWKSYLDTAASDQGQEHFYGSINGQEPTTNIRMGQPGAFRWLDQLSINEGTGQHTLDIDDIVFTTDISADDGNAANHIFVAAVDAPLTVDGRASATDVLLGASHIGSHDPRLDGTLAGINAPVTISNASLTLVDASDPYFHHAVLDGTSLTGAAPVDFEFAPDSGLYSLDYIGGSDTFLDVNNTPAPTTIEGGFQEVFVVGNVSVLTLKGIAIVDLGENYDGTGPRNLYGQDADIYLENSGRNITQLFVGDENDALPRLVSFTAVFGQPNTPPPFYALQGLNVVFGFPNNFYPTIFIAPGVLSSIEVGSQSGNTVTVEDAPPKLTTAFFLHPSDSFIVTPDVNNLYGNGDLFVSGAGTATLQDFFGGTLNRLEVDGEPERVFYQQIGKLEIDGVGGGLGVNGTAAGTTTVFNGQSSEDETFDIGLASQMNGPLFLNGGTGNNTIERSFVIPQFKTSTFQADAASITAGPDGALWFIEAAADQIARITTDGHITEYPAFPADSPDDLVAGPDGNLWFINRSTNQICRFDLTSHDVDVAANTDPGFTLDRLAAAPSGIWFAESNGTSSNIGQITAGGVTLTPVAENASLLTLGPDGKSLWFLESSAGSSPTSPYDHLGEIVNGQGPTQVPFSLPPAGGRVPAIGQMVFDLTAGPDGNLWATVDITRSSRQLGEFTQGEILKINLGGQILQTVPLSTGTLQSFVGQIISGPDGNLWLLDDTTTGPSDNLNVARLSPSGKLLQLDAASGAVGIASGPDGNVWFTEGSEVGEINLTQSAQWQVDGSNLGGMYRNKIRFSNIQNLTGGLLGGDTFQFLSSPEAPASLSGKLSGGLSPATLDESQDPGVTVTKTGTGTLHGSKGTATNILGGFDNIDLVISPTAPGSLKFDDAANTSPTTWTITSASVTRQVQGQPATTIPIANVASLEIDGGSGGNSFMVIGPPVLPGGITIHGGSSADSLTITQPTDPTAPPWIITGNSVIIPVQGINVTVNYDGLGSLVLNGPPGSTGFAVQSTVAGTSTTINSNGNDLVTVGNKGSVQSILGPLSIDPANATLIVDDSADPTARTATLTSTSITGLSPAPITFDSGVTNLTVDGGSGGNSFLMPDGPPNLPAGITIHGGGSADSLTITQPTDPTGPNWIAAGNSLIFIPLQGNNATINYDGLGSLVLNGPPGSTKFDIQGTAAGTTTIINCNGTDPVTVGNNGSVQGILGSLTITGPGATLDVDDSADPTPRTITITPTTISGLSPAVITYVGISNLIVDGGYGGNMIAVTNTASGTNTTVNSGNGIDFVYVRGTTGPLSVNTQGSTGSGFNGFEVVIVGAGTASLSGIQGALTVNTLGRPGLDYTTMALFDTVTTTPETYTLTDNTILRSGSAPIYYRVTNQLQFYLGSGGNLVNIQSTFPGLPEVFVGGVGNDTFNVGDSFHTLNSIQSHLSFQVANAGSQVILHDEGQTANVSYTLAYDPNISPSNFIRRSTSGYYILYSGPLKSLQLNAGSGNDTFNVRTLPPSSTTVTLDGGAGSNTLQGPNQNNNWQITGANAGSLDSNIVFANIQNLVGGTANDTFAIRKSPFFRFGGKLTGSINGGGGTDTLDYSGYTGDVTVNMRLGTASQVLGGISNIANVSGSQGNNLIVGDANPHTFIGGSGRNIIIGGAGPDQITGGGGDNILIGGTTVWDANPGALQAIMQEWTNTTLSFDQRVNALRKGITVGGKTYALNASTVMMDSSPDSLIGGPGQNWFFLDFDDVINNGAGPGANDRVTRV